MEKAAEVKGDPGKYLDRLKKFIQSQSIELFYSDTIGRAEGLSTGGKIIIRKDLSPAQAFSVTVHELAHEKIHHNGTEISESKSIRETEAESVACVVSQAVGLDCNTASSDYINLYDGKKETLMASLERIYQTAAQIIDAITHEDKKPSPLHTESQIQTAAA